MCWFYEIEYGACFDHFDGNVDYNNPKRSVTAMLENEYNVDIVDFDEFEWRIIQTLTDMHENGIIKPNKNCKEPTEDEIKHYFEGYKYKKFPLLKTKEWIRKEIDTAKDETDDIIGWFMDNYPVWESKGEKIKITVEVLEPKSD